MDSLRSYKVFLLAVAFALLARAADLRNCRQNRSASAGSVAWWFDGHGGISASSDARTTGTVTMKCRVRLPSPVHAVTLAHEDVLVSFLPRGTRETGGGFVASITDGRRPLCSVNLTRVAGEDWIEAGRLSYSISFEKPLREVTVELKLIDNSDRVPVRIDIRNLTIQSGRSPDARPCPTASEAGSAQDPKRR